MGGTPFFAPVEVCPDCDIADCHHIRLREIHKAQLARKTLIPRPDPSILTQLTGPHGRKDV